MNMIGKFTHKKMFAYLVKHGYNKDVHLNEHDLAKAYYDVTQKEIRLLALMKG
jgi:hypothetical protein